MSSTTSKSRVGERATAGIVLPNVSERRCAQSVAVAAPSGRRQSLRRLLTVSATALAMSQTDSKMMFTTSA